MWRQQFFKILILICLCIHTSVQLKKQKTSVITDIDDIKDFKKLLRTKTNVLVLYINNVKASQQTLDVFKESADNMKGQATLVVLDCSSGDGKKLCKKLKVQSDKSYILKHYKDGDYHKDYDRGVTVSAMVNFLRDPTGDLPWEEDPNAGDIVHLIDGEALNKFLKKGIATYKKAMIMFYAPWCGYCKTLKPDYVAAAADLKGEAFLAAIDVSKPGNSKIRQVYNITGFPTLLFFEKGQYRYPYNGDNKHKAIVNFMRDPTSQIVKKEPVDESWSKDSDVLHLTESTFEGIMSKAEHALVVFYAPWCGHCKRIKPEFEKAAARMKSEKIKGLLAAVDATQESSLASRFGVKGYPTLKYFNKGVYKYDAGHARQEDQIIDFIKSPQEPPPPPPPETPWSEQESSVRHLDSSTFRNTLRKIKHALVMFYAPWCGHCKSTKPEFVKASDRFADELIIAFGAVDCTLHKDICGNYDVKGYPTIKYFSHFDKVIQDYTGGRKEADFVSFINNQLEKQQLSQKAKSNQDAGFGVNVRLADDNSFSDIIARDGPTFVMFYATWCGHCSTVKPAYSRVATTLINDNSPAIAIAVDAAENPKVADLASIQTLPTFKIYQAGRYLADYEGDRSMEDMLKFVKSYVKSPQEPPPPPPPETPWSEQESSVRHLDSSTFRNTLRKIKHALVMFYAPWCGHCKSTKPEFVKASDRFADELIIAFGAVDCTLHKDICGNYDVKGYPTIKYFSHFDKVIQDYTGGRKEADFVSFINNQLEKQQLSQKAKSNQDAGFGVNVRLADDNSFSDVIARDGPTFVMFYATWCGHCSTVKPAYSRVATTLINDNSPAIAIAVDAAENPKVADLASIQTLPTFKIYQAGRYLADYEGDRSMEDMLKFVKSYVKVKDEL